MAENANSVAKSPVVSLKTATSNTRDHPFRRSMRYFIRNRFGVVALMVIILITAASMLASQLSDYDPVGIDAQIRLQAPSMQHLMGTDSLGRDVLTRVLYGGQVSLQIGFLSILLAVSIGVPLGLVAGYIGGSTDNIIMRVMDLILAFPGLILVIWLVGLLGASIFNVIFAIALFSLPTFARLTRGITLSLEQRDFVLAARSMGASSFRIMFRHILPNALGSLIVVTTLSISEAIITGASLSFLGLGVRPPTPEWGAMLADGQSYLRNAWWISVFPGLVITTVVLAMNIVGDVIRDAFDPTTLK